MVALGPIQANCFLVGAAGSGRCVIIDPGAEPDRVLGLLEQEQLDAEAILITHGHFDHIGGVAGVARALGIPVHMPGGEAGKLEQLAEDGPEPFGPFESWHVDHDVPEGSVIDRAGVQLHVLSVPGHSPAHVAFLAPGVRGDDGSWTQPPMIFSGDVLFEQSIGRADLPGSDPAQLMRTLRYLLSVLDDATVVCPGHMGITTVGAERVRNPFLQELT